jgi:hypothetical protein
MPLLNLREVRVVHITGARRVTDVQSEQFSYVSEKFEPVYVRTAGSN